MSNDMQGSSATSPGVDPDPITVALALIAAAAGGGAYLEARRQRNRQSERDRAILRTRWAAAGRAVNALEHATSDLRIAVDEFDFGSQRAVLGDVRLLLQPQEKRFLRGLARQCRDTTGRMENTFDELSDSLGEEYESDLGELNAALAEQLAHWDQDYNSVVGAAEQCIRLYRGLLDRISAQEGFERQ